MACYQNGPMAEAANTLLNLAGSRVSWMQAGLGQQQDTDMHDSDDMAQDEQMVLDEPGLQHPATTTAVDSPTVFKPSGAMPSSDTSSCSAPGSSPTTTPSPLQPPTSVSSSVPTLSESVHSSLLYLSSYSSSPPSNSTTHPKTKHTWQDSQSISFARLSPAAELYTGAPGPSASSSSVSSASTASRELSSLGSASTSASSVPSPPTSTRSVPSSSKRHLFDHREPYKWHKDPFCLENAPELQDPEHPVFPLAIQEEDPDPVLFPVGALAPSTPPMGGNKRSGDTATAPNQNLVGHRIDSGRLELTSILGLGAYGVVYLARDLTSKDPNSPRLYAVKALTKVGLDARQRSFQRREIALHTLASSHPSIVTLHNVFETPSCIFVVLDYCPDGDLFGMITEQQRYLGNEERVKKVLIQIIAAVEFCHRLGIAHRDLKPENILCKKNGEEVVLADFGLATAEKTSSDFGCGSTFYMSPECQGGLFERLGSYSTVHNDIWSLGVILVNLTCGRNPWKQACPTDETFRAYLQNPDFLRSILPISRPCNELLKRIFSINPLARISLAELRAEVVAMKTFTMTPDELRTATRATREAARAWQEVPSPRPCKPSEWQQETPEARRRREKKAAAAAKAAAVQAREAARAAASEREAAAEASRHVKMTVVDDPWTIPVRYENSDCSSLGSLFGSESSISSGSAWSIDPPVASFAAGTTQEDTAPTPRSHFVTPPATPRNRQQHRCSPALVEAFSSASLSDTSLPNHKGQHARGAAPAPISVLSTPQRAAYRHGQAADASFPPTPSTPSHPGPSPVRRQHDRRHVQQHRSPRVVQRGTPSSSDRSSDGHPSMTCSSSSSLGGSLPATPQSPVFGRRMAGGNGGAATGVVVTTMVDLFGAGSLQHRKTSGMGERQASFKSLYPAYAEWADSADVVQHVVA